MRDDRDQLLDALFDAARRESPDTGSPEAHFETRLLARLAERRAQVVLWQRLVWRLIPAFSVVAVVAAVCSITFDPARSTDIFAPIANGAEERIAGNFLLGE